MKNSLFIERTNQRMNRVAAACIENATNSESFQRELSNLLNTHCAENQSGTPDYILATYLTQCLRAFNEATNARHEHLNE